MGFVGKTGKDADGERFWNALQSIRPHAVRALGTRKVAAKSAQTARCLVLCWDNGYRSFAYDVGCADQLGPADLNLLNLRHAKLILIEGLLLKKEKRTRELLLDLIGELAADATGRNGPTIVVTMSDVHGWSAQAAAAKLIADSADIVIGNYSEQADFCNAIGWDHTGAVLPKLNQQFVITMGAFGAIAITKRCRKRAGARAEGQVETYYAQAPKLTGVSSSVGAGDAFLVGYLLAQLKEPQDIRLALKMGSSAARVCLSRQAASAYCK